MVGILEASKFSLAASASLAPRPGRNCLAGLGFRVQGLGFRV